MHTLFLNLLYIVAIGINVVLLRYFSLYLDPLNNNGIRFLSGAVCLLIWVVWRYRRSLLQLIKTPKLFALTLLVGGMMCANMYFYLKGVAMTNAVTASILGVIAMPLGVLMAAVFFQDERQKMRRVQFWLGCLLTILGCVGFIWSGKSLELGEAFLLGSFFLLLSVIIRNTQNVLVKLTNNKINVITLSCITSFSTAIISLSLSYQQDNWQPLYQLSPLFFGGLLLFGVYAIGVGMILAFHIIQKQGIITYQILELLIPLSTALVAYVLLGETISPLQAVCAVIVLVGASLALNLFQTTLLARRGLE